MTRQITGSFLGLGLLAGAVACNPDSGNGEGSTEKDPARSTGTVADLPDAQVGLLPGFWPKPEGNDDLPVDTNPVIDENGKGWIDPATTINLGEFVLGLGVPKSGLVQSAFYTVLDVDGYLITGSGMTPEGQPCGLDPEPCADRGSYDPDTGILTATIQVTNNTGMGRGCIALQYLSEFNNAYNPGCPGVPYTSTAGNSQAPADSMPLDQLRVCEECTNATSCTCLYDSDCDPLVVGGTGRCIWKGTRTTPNNIYVIGPLAAGETSAPITVQIATHDGGYCPHRFLVVDEVGGDEPGCGIVCGDRIIATNAGETCEPFGEQGVCSQQRGTVPAGVPTLDCSRDWECVFQGTCDNDPSVACVNNHQCPVRPLSDFIGAEYTTLFQLLDPVYNPSGHIPSEFRGNCTVGYDWGPCVLPSDTPDLGCGRQTVEGIDVKEICQCVEIAPHNHNDFPVVDRSQPGSCIPQPFPYLTREFLDAGCLTHAQRAYENTQLKKMGLPQLPEISDPANPATWCCEATDHDTTSDMPPATCCARPDCCTDPAYPVGPKTDPTCPCGKPPLFECPASFSQDILPILTRRCISCHPSQGGLDVNGYAPLMAGTSANGPVVIPGDAGNSELYLKVACWGQLPGFCVNNTPMPPGFSLSGSEIKLIFDWIQSGAPDN